MNTVSTYSILCLILAIRVGRAQDCPDEDPTLTPWNPGDQPALDVVIDGVGYLLTDSASLNSIDITNGGRLVIADVADITLRVRHILIQRNGEFHVGSETCPYAGQLTITLHGLIGDADPGVAAFGKKFIGVAPSGTIEMHGKPKKSWTVLTTSLFGGGSGDIMLDLADDVSSWEVGDKIVIASSDFESDHAEVFDIINCGPCTVNQVRVAASPLYDHFGEISEGVDMRAEVGLLTRNVKIEGEVAPTCYGDSERCPYFDVDIFGGQTQVLMGFTAAHFSDLELHNMGQQILGSYPIHFHRVGEAYGAYARRLSIHDTRSRCITVHGAEGLLIEDNVGYNSIGHCFFLEDGNEVNNTIRHNLGIATKAGSLLPHDRNSEMCSGLLGAVQPGHTPDPLEECMGASTFWFTHPDNIVEDNVAAGSEQFGFFFVFHREPTGPSAGTLPPFHGERSPLASFVNNKAHSNMRGGLSLDKGLKIDAASAEDGREFLAFIKNGRFSPHVDRDLSLPRTPAIIDRYTSYKNFKGAFLRGGDIFVRDSNFADDVRALTLVSENTLPYDIGSHQEVVRTNFLGRTANFKDHEIFLSYHQKAIEIRDGPILVDSCIFNYYSASAMVSMSSALAFYRNHMGQNSPANTFKNLTFVEPITRLWFGGSPGFPGDDTADGAITQILYDDDGSISGHVGAYLVRDSQDILNRPGCTPLVDFAGAACVGDDYGQVYFQASTTTLNMTVVHRNGVTVNPYVLSGVQNDDEGVYTTNNYQPVLVSTEEYNIHWNGVAPDNIIVSPHNFQNGWVNLALCYPSQTTFSLFREDWDQLSDNVLQQNAMTLGSSANDVDLDASGNTYFWNESERLLYVKSVQSRSLNGYNYCSDAGCERINIQATIINQETSDCRS